MRGLRGALLVGLVVSSAAQAQDWRTYTYPDPGFAIQFPAVPEVQTATVKNAVGVTLPVTRYVVRQEGVQYTLSVANYSNTNADALAAIGEAARSFKAKGKVDANRGARVNGSSGRELTITESDGSRSDIAIFFVGNRLYTAVGQALPPNPQERSGDTARFQHSLQFPSDDSGFFGLFGARDRGSSSAPAPTTVVMGSNSANGSGDGARSGGGADNGARASSGASAGNGGSSGGASSGVSTGNGTGVSSGVSAGNGRSTGNGGSRGDSSAGERRGVANQRADAACAGKAAGDVVQLDTPAGPVPATCILTARPNPPAGNTPGGARDGRN